MPPTTDPCTPEYADAPFCAGPSLRECPGGLEVAEDAACPGNFDLAGGAIGAIPGTCEYDNTCDDGEGALDGAPVALTAEPPVPELAATGLPASHLAYLAMVLIVAGVALCTAVRR